MKWTWLLRKIRNNKPAYAIVVFMACFSVFHFILKPSVTYFPDGQFRPFGIQFTDETWLPIWAVSFVLGILSYVFILYLSSTVVTRYKK